MKVATWNVNGIRARSSQVVHWIDGEEPDVICLQEIKAPADKVPEPLGDIAGYHAHWHGSGGYSGVALMLRTARFPEPPAFVHPHFDLESRIVVAEVGELVFASVYVPNGGKDFAAKLVFLRELEQWAGQLERAGKYLVLCGDFNVARAPIDVHPVLRKDMVGQRKVERDLIDALPPCRSRQRPAVHVVGAVAEPAPAQYRLAPRLHRRPSRARRRRGDL
jgi:exodeoxyribonuclease-3